MEVQQEKEKRHEKAADVSLGDLSKKLDEFAKERDWEKHHNPRNLLLAMVGMAFKYSIACKKQDAMQTVQGIHASIFWYKIGEVGELSEIFMWRGEVAKGLPDWEESDKEHLGEELSDVLLYLIRLADMCGVDLGEAATKKIVKNAIKYPPNQGLQ